MDTITIPSYNSSTGAGTLSSIASEHGVSINDIIAANKGNTAAIPDPSNPNLIKAGATLNIPKPSVIQTTTAQRAETQANIQKLNTLQTQGTGATIFNNTDPSNPSNGNNGGTGNTPSIDTTTGEIKDAKGNVIGKTTESMKKDQGADTAGDPLSDMKSQIEEIKGWGQTQINNMKSTLDQLSASSDAKTRATISMIQSMYADRIAAVKEAYGRLGQAKDMNDFRNGVNRYTPYQGQGVLTDNEVQEQTKITDFMTKMFDAITKAQNAQDANDTKTLNLEMTKVSQIQKDINQSVSNLYKSALEFQKQTAKQTADIQKQKQTEFKTYMDISKRIAPALATSLANIKTEKERKSFIEKYAKENGLDPAILSGDVQDYMNKANVTNAKEQRAEDANNRANDKAKNGGATTPKGGTDGSFKYTPNDVSAYSDLLNKGGKAPDGTVFNARGSDGFVDPTAYLAAYKDWISQGGTPKGFTKVFPVTNVNPDSYSKLPQAIQPKSSSGQSKNKY